jgi:uncharacterized membrane protein YdbT with pleckstrin-like domain
MSYVEKVLMPDEKIIYAATLHWIIYLQGLWITALGGAMGFFSVPFLTILFGPTLAEQFSRPVCAVAILVVLFGVYMLGIAYMRQNSTELVVTDKRLIAKYGIVGRTTFEILINRITGANFDQTVTGRILGYGTVLVHGAGGEISPFGMIDQPQVFYRALVSVLRTR